eukprot:scaffold13569_cov240-Alexandrium_tamarense.AAC.4
MKRTLERSVEWTKGCGGRDGGDSPSTRSCDDDVIPLLVGLLLSPLIMYLMYDTDGLLYNGRDAAFSSKGAGMLSHRLVRPLFFSVCVTRPVKGGSRGCDLSPIGDKVLI